MFDNPMEVLPLQAGLLSRLRDVALVLLKDSVNVLSMKGPDHGLFGLLEGEAEHGLVEIGQGPRVLCVSHEIFQPDALRLAQDRSPLDDVF